MSRTRRSGTDLLEARNLIKTMLRPIMCTKRVVSVSSGETRSLQTPVSVSPMVYQTEWRDVPYLKNEVFGPHVALIPFDTTEEAISIYNDTDYGLAVGVVTEDFKKARLCRENCDYGMCYWNGGSIAAESHMAFGGVKKSGNGFPSAARTFRAVTHEVSWTVNHDDQLNFPQGMK